MICKVMQDLTTIWLTIFGLDFKVVHVFSCDHGSLQQEFIRSHWSPELLFRDLEEVGSSDMAFDVISETFQPVPSTFLLATGIECDTLSMLSTQSRMGESVVAKGEGKTGSSARFTMGYVERRLPDMLLFECVKGLASPPKPSTALLAKPSDLDTIIKWGNTLGYILWPAVLEASDYGSPAPRPRQYILGFHTKQPDPNFTQLHPVIKGQTEPESYIFPRWWYELHTIMEEFKVEALPIQEYFLPLGDPNRGEWKAYPQRSSIDLPLEPKKGKSEDPQWEADHCTAYQQGNLIWPPTFPPSFAEKTSHLGRRMAELVWYYEQITAQEVLVRSFLDINFSMSWARISTDRPGCLVCSSHIWCFGRSRNNDLAKPGDEDAGMELCGEEALAIMGFSLPALNRAFTSLCHPRDHDHV